MKKTLSISLGGRPFTIDEDAYTLLDSYLQQVEQRQGRAESMEQIELRLAAILGESGAAVLDLRTVREAMERLGAPDSFGMPPVSSDTAADKPKRLWRSRKDRVIGGVCGGMGDYFGIDPLAIRLVFLILLLFGGGGLILYIVFWIVIPPVPLNLPGGNNGNSNI